MELLSHPEVGGESGPGGRGVVFLSGIFDFVLSWHNLHNKKMVSLSPPTGVSAAILPGSRSRGGTIQLWPNPVPFECGIIHMLEKQVSRAPAKNGCQRFPVTVSF